MLFYQSEQRGTDEIEQNDRCQQSITELKIFRIFKVSINENGSHKCSSISDLDPCQHFVFNIVCVPEKEANVSNVQGRTNQIDLNCWCVI